LTAPRVQSGFSETHRAEVAALFWDAFEGKLRSSLAPKPKALAFIEGGLNPAFAYSATSEDGRLLGVVGIRTSKGGLFSGTLRTLAAVYGWVGALWRGAILSVFDRDPVEGQLLLDGLFVSAAARGQGIGTSLLDAAVWHARMNRCSSIRLDVVDTNPRARALYERYGFEPAGTVKTGVLAGLLGFGQATTMVLTLDADQTSG